MKLWEENNRPEIIELLKFNAKPEQDQPEKLIIEKDKELDQALEKTIEKRIIDTLSSKKEIIKKGEILENKNIKKNLDDPGSNASDDADGNNADNEINNMEVDADAEFDLSLLLSKLSTAGKLRFVSPDVLRRAYNRMMEIGIELSESEGAVGEEKQNEQERKEFLRSYGNLKALCDSVDGLRDEEQEVDFNALGMNEQSQVAAKDSLMLSDLYNKKMIDRLDDNADGDTLLKTPIMSEPIYDPKNIDGESKFNSLQAILQQKKLEEEQRLQNERLAKQKDDVDKEDQLDSSNIVKPSDKKVDKANPVNNVGNGNTPIDGIRGIIQCYQALSQNKDNPEQNKQEKEKLKQDLEIVVAYKLLAGAGMSQDTIKDLLLNTTKNSSSDKQKSYNSIIKKVNNLLSNSGIISPKGDLLDFNNAELDRKISETSQNIMAQAACGNGFLVRTDARNLPEKSKEMMVYQTLEMSQKDRDKALLEGLSGDEANIAKKFWRSLFSPSAETLAEEEKTPWFQIGIEALICPPLLFLRINEIKESTPVKVLVGISDAIRIGVSAAQVAVTSVVGSAVGIGKCFQNNLNEDGTKKSKWSVFKETFSSMTEDGRKNIKTVWGGFSELPEESKAKEAIKKMKNKHSLEKEDEVINAFLDGKISVKPQAHHHETTEKKSNEKQNLPKDHGKTDDEKEKKPELTEEQVQQLVSKTKDIKQVLKSANAECNVSEQKSIDLRADKEKEAKKVAK